MDGIELIIEDELKLRIAELEQVLKNVRDDLVTAAVVCRGFGQLPNVAAQMERWVGEIDAVLNPKKEDGDGKDVPD